MWRNRSCDETEMLKTQYRIFLWNKFDFSEYKDSLTILNVGFVDNYYMAVMQSKKNELEHTIIVKNIKNPTQIPLQAEYGQGGYHVFNRNKIDRLPKKLINKLNKNGLFKTDKENRSPNAKTSIHRLVSCIDGNCKGLDVHHINKDIHQNDICNLVPVTTEQNNELEYIKNYYEDGFNIMLQEGYRLKAKDEEQKRNIKRYMKDNESLQLEIIEYGINHKPSEAIHKYKRYIGTPQIIRNIYNYFYYKVEFLNWLKTRSFDGYSI